MINKIEILNPLLQIIEDLQLTKMIFPGVVYQDNDPRMLGRLRILPSQKSYDDAIKSIPDWKEETDAWTKKDPILYLPLLPYYFYQIPKKGEYVHIILYDPRKQDGNRFYIQGPFSDPRRIPIEKSESSVTYLSSGDRVEETLSIKDEKGEYRDKNSYGVYPEPGDNAFLGRGSADVVVKPEEILIRAGKTKKIVDNELPIGSSLRSFLQLSNFDRTKIAGPKETKLTFNEVVKVVRKIIIWNIDNLENNSDIFNGSIGIYNVIPNSTLVNTKNFKYDTITKLSIGVDYQGPIEEFRFLGKSSQDIINLTNQIIRGLFEGFLQITDYTVNNQNNFQNAFPFIVTPSKTVYEKGVPLKQNLTPIEEEQKKNFSNFEINIKLDSTKNESGFFLVSENKNQKPIYGPLLEPKIFTTTPSTYVDNSVTYGVLGGQKLYLLSHDSAGPKGKINLSETLYGINQEKFIGDENSIEKLTYSTVRGEEIIKLLRKMVAYIKGHVHPISTMEPIRLTGGNGQSIDEIDQILADAENSILNQNIRIN